MSAIDRYNQRAIDANSLLCVGLDSVLDRLPGAFQQQDAPLRAFNRHIIEQTHPYVAAYKFNTAFYEARGSVGWDELGATLAYLRREHPAIWRIADAKRADIGHTSAAYARAFFDAFDFDAVTLHPYLGREALAPFLSRADKACIVLCRTSNPGAGELQDLDVGGRPLWAHLAQQVSQTWNAHDNCLLVVGATYPDELRQIRALVGDMTLLVPGIGAQGGDLGAVMRHGRNAAGLGLIVSASRSVIYADEPGAAARDLRDAINAQRV